MTDQNTKQKAIEAMKRVFEEDAVDDPLPHALDVALTVLAQHYKRQENAVGYLVSEELNHIKGLPV